MPFVRVPFAATLLFAAVASAEVPASNAIRQRVANFHRAGWYVVDGRFAQVQADFPQDTLFSLVETQEHFALVARSSPRAEPLLRNYRTALVRLAGSDYAWKMSCPGRVWDDTRAAGTQQLLLVAAADAMAADKTLRLTKIEITPVQQTAQAVVLDENDEPLSVIVVFGRDFVEATAGPFGRPPTTLIRSTTARRLMAERPVETRQYVVPLLRLLTGGPNPLAAAAGDVYRAFPDLPADPVAASAVAAVLKDFAAPEPAARQRATDALHALGRRGVQAAMRVDPKRLPPEAAERLASFVAESTRDRRPAEALRHDPNFLLDCLQDADPGVRNEAGKYVGK